MSLTLYPPPKYFSTFFMFNSRPSKACLFLMYTTESNKIWNYNFQQTYLSEFIILHPQSEAGLDLFWFDECRNPRNFPSALSLYICSAPVSWMRPSDCRVNKQQEDRTECRLLFWQHPLRRKYMTAEVSLFPNTRESLAENWSEWDLLSAHPLCGVKYKLWRVKK